MSERSNNQVMTINWLISHKDEIISIKKMESDSKQLTEFRFKGRAVIMIDFDLTESELKELRWFDDKLHF